MERRPHETLFMWTGLCTHEHTMFARSPQCFIDVDLDCHLVKTLKVSMPTAHDYTDYEFRQLAVSMIPRGSREFTLTNAGLHMFVILYEITEVTHLGDARWSLSVKGLQPYNHDSEGNAAREISQNGGSGSRVAVAGSGRIACGQLLLRLIRSLATSLSALWLRLCGLTPTKGDAETAGVFPVTSFTGEYPLHERGNHKRLRLGILDYERHDAQGDPRAFERELYNSWSVYYHEMPDDKEQLTKDILKARETRRYTAVLLYVAIPDENRPLERIATEENIHVRRPTIGWRKPQSVYIR